MSKRGKNRFRKSEVERAILAAKKTGAVVERIDVDPASEKFSVIISKPDDGDNAKTGNEVEDWINKQQKSKKG